ncbi:MAG: aminopeptidase [Gemmatimonadota bacterium]|nr:aminopeptidase [Gemmatimonadota bacterium]
MRRIPLLVLLLLLAGCSPIYVLRAGYEEAKILARRQPIQRLVDDPRTPEETRRKLALVLDARTFAADTLGLDVGRSYTAFSQLDSDTLALVLSAAHRDRFEAHTWWFPIVGRVPYKGFFSERSARREIARLEARGFDTYLRPTSAFSTLGWFNDPLVSPLLRYDSVQLANTVIHELFHNTLFVSGQVQFNESVANFVGARGAIRFFCGREGEQGPRCRQARAAWQDELRFGAFLEELVHELEALYARANLSSEQKVAAREEVFRRARGRFGAEVKPRLQVLQFGSFERLPLNNATLIGRRLYYGRLELFERVWERYGRDLPLALRAITAAAAQGEDPYAAVEALLWQ